MAAHRREGDGAANDGMETAGPGIAELPLPDDMMVAIFGHLDAKTQLMVVPSVCKSWARIHRHQMPPARLDFGDHSSAQRAALTDAVMLSIARRVRLLDSLDLTGCDSVTPSITQLTLGSKLATHDVVATLGKCCPKLVKLGLSSDLLLLPAEIGQLTGLQALSLIGCSQLASLPIEIEKLTGLRVLSLDARLRRNLPDDLVQTLAANGTTL
jgi:hypothetical protein